ncbi:MAG: hypothetical protein ACL7BU_16515 [Candidatus Phlomobacter fragariae]
MIVKKLYPELFHDWSTHYPKTEKSPYAAANAYLQQAKGLDIAPLKGLYIKSSYHG